MKVYLLKYDASYDGEPEDYETTTSKISPKTRSL